LGGNDSNMVERTKKLFPTEPKQLAPYNQEMFDPTLHVDAPFILQLSPDVEGAALLDLLRWVHQEHGLDQQTVSCLAYTLFFRLIGIDGLIDAATQEQWMQLSREVKERVE
jgi:hypothetical protein